jgi:thiamine-phosphate pyrophosphorylase
MDGGWLLERVQRVVERVGRRAAVVVNDRPDVALAAGADGVHVGQTDLPPLAVRRVVGRQLLLGVSCSNAGHAARAFERGADYCGLGPMFPSSTKARDFVAGPSLLRAFHEAFPERPYLAIGGITPDNVGELARAGCRGVAVCAAVCGSVDPGLAVRRLLEALPSPVSPDEPAGPSDEAAAST